MTPERRWIALRTLVWIGILVYAVTIIRDKAGADAVGSAMVEAAGLGPQKVVWTVIDRPGAAAPAASAAPAGAGTELAVGTDAADALAVFAQLFDEACPAPARSFRFSLGPTGLSSVSASGTTSPCVAERVWAARWPTPADAVELELGE